MTDYLTYELGLEDLHKISTLGLAHIGDGVYELLWRSYLCAHGKKTSKGLHFETVRHVKAQAQAVAMEKILPQLTEEEHSFYKRGRNAKVNSVPKNAKIADYHSATGLECLFGYLYLKGDKDRINTLFSYILEE